MRWWLLVLCGCNQVFGLPATAPADAQYFDAPPREPPHCPLVGHDLAFSPQLHQLHDDCTYYDVSLSANLAIAMCLDADQLQISSGPPDGPFSRVAELPASSPNLSLTPPEIDPDAQILLLATFDLSQTMARLQVFHRDGTQWIADPDVPNGPPRVSNPSHGPAYRFLGTSGITDVSEYAFDGSWQNVHTHPLATLGVPSVGDIWLSSDALRMLFVANAYDIQENRYMAYADRATTDDTFGAARRLSMPFVPDAFITEDCGRLYFSGLHSIFYAESK